MADKTPAADQSTESTTAVDSAANENASPADSSKSVKKLVPSYTLHSVTQSAIRYLAFMLSESGKPQTANQIVQEAVARHLTYMAKQGNEYPPKMLADLTRLGLIK